jgi:hydroxymethylglutaryl-CoA synthase
MCERLKTTFSMDDVTDVGIVGISVYFPRRSVSQEDLEIYDGVSAGKYTIGLGQTNMAIVHDNEDVVSICLTVLQRLVDRYNISFKDIGRLEVGTETILDKSKSVKSSLMQLFDECGNHDVEGLDNTNACYGSTAALFNTIAWAESSAWDGRYGVVVAGDIAVYAPGPARPTGGAGAVALLVGRGSEAPIRLETGLRASCFGHSYDFFKPRLGSEYPTVNGQETIDCFVRAIDSCYSLYRSRAEKKKRGRSKLIGPVPTENFTIAKDVDYCVFHAPFDKMVQRAIARLVYNDFLETTPDSDPQYAEVELFRSLSRESSHRDRNAMRGFVSYTKPLYEAKCSPATWLAREIGNAYTASLYSSLAALILRVGADLEGRRILMFGFGSGYASSMFSLRVVGSVDRIVRSLFDIEEQLGERQQISATAFESILKQREADYCRFSYVPGDCPSDLFSGTYYVDKVDEQGRRTYKRFLASR